MSFVSFKRDVEQAASSYPGIQVSITRKERQFYVRATRDDGASASGMVSDGGCPTKDAREKFLADTVAALEYVGD